MFLFYTYIKGRFPQRNPGKDTNKCITKAELLRLNKPGVGDVDWESLVGVVEGSLNEEVGTGNSGVWAKKLRKEIERR